MKDLELHITALNASAAAEGNFVIVLQPVNDTKKLSIIIGLPEAQAVAVAIEQLETARPLTHDLFLNAITRLKATLECVKITGIKDGIFISVIVLKDNAGNLLEIDSRTSDAIALAVKQKAGIFISEELFAELSTDEAAEGRTFSEKKGRLEQCSLEELYEMLTKILEKEDYEKAGVIRDIISKKERQ